MQLSDKIHKESIFWIISAGELHLSAFHLWNAFSSDATTLDTYAQKMGLHLKSALPRTFAMNAGLSIELGIKACIVQRLGFLSKKTKDKTEGHYHHNLLKLKSDAGIILSEYQEKQLEILTEFISWAGRYPIGTDGNSFEKLMSKLEDLGINDPRRLDVSPISWDDYLSIWNKILYHYQGIGGGGTITEDGTWIGDFKDGPVWKVVKEIQKDHSTTFVDHKVEMSVAEAFILAEKLNAERIMNCGVFVERYYTDEM